MFDLNAIIFLECLGFFSMFDLNAIIFLECLGFFSQETGLGIVMPYSSPL